jgi:hypothetical protein
VIDLIVRVKSPTTATFAPNHTGPRNAAPTAHGHAPTAVVGAVANYPP